MKFVKTACVRYRTGAVLFDVVVVSWLESSKETKKLLSDEFATFKSLFQITSKSPRFMTYGLNVSYVQQKYDACLGWLLLRFSASGNCGRSNRLPRLDKYIFAAAIRQQCFACITRLLLLAILMNGARNPFWTPWPAHGSRLCALRLSSNHQRSAS